ncbi:MAG: glycine--tRNA ligase [Methanobacteriaceae archaeon]|nr:glycine--tRNA ligase [Methanobacteriaceae archaeon]
MTNNKMISIAKKRGYLYPSFEIYSGVAGFYDYGPLGSMLKNNILNLWRQYYTVQEGYYEIESPTVMPKEALKASGHVDNFTDPMTQCHDCQQVYRADHIIGEAINKEVEGLPDSKLTEIIAENNITCTECGGKLEDVYSYNLMFKTKIGANGKKIGYMRPETAQGIFIAFKRLARFYKDKLPFGVVQIGKAYRNELSPRQGMIRLREFTLAETEIFVDPTDKTTPKFDSIKNEKIKLFSQQLQEENKEAEYFTVKEALEQNIVPSEILAYQIYLAKTFLTEIGLPENKFRFRQNLPDERAHYALDCWDGEVETDEYGWIEILGIADRTDYDLSSHIKDSKEDLTIFKEYDTVKTVTKTVPIINNKNFGRTLKKDSTEAKEIIENTNPETIINSIKENGSYIITIGNNNYDIDETLITFETKKIEEKGEKVVPHVIEPSFGVDRIVYSLLLHSYTEDENEDKETRKYLRITPQIAPVKAVILPLVNKEELTTIAKDIEFETRKNNLITMYDVSGTIGRRYARSDEIGVPYAITIDYDSLEDKKVTIRSRDTLKQKRIFITEISKVLTDLLNNNIKFEEITE